MSVTDSLSPKNEAELCAYVIETYWLGDGLIAETLLTENNWFLFEGAKKGISMSER